MSKLLTHLLTVAIALGTTAWLLPGVHVTSWAALAVAALILGFVNAIVRPLITILTLPLTILTFGLFLLVVNGLAFALAAMVVPGFSTSGFGWSILGALMVSVVSTVIGWILKEEKK